MIAQVDEQQIAVNRALRWIQPESRTVVPASARRSSPQFMGSIGVHGTIQ